MAETMLTLWRSYGNCHTEIVIRLYESSLSNVRPRCMTGLWKNVIKTHGDTEKRGFSVLGGSRKKKQNSVKGVSYGRAMWWQLRRGMWFY